MWFHMVQESGSAYPIFESGTTAIVSDEDGYETVRGVWQRLSDGQQAFGGEHTGRAFTESLGLTNFAMAHKFGTSNPLYVFNRLGFSFNCHWDGSTWRFSDGSSSQYAGLLYFDLTTCSLKYEKSTAAGNDGAAVTFAAPVTLA